MFKVGIKRTNKQMIVTVKTDVPDEKPFKFKTLSPTITQKHLRMILPMMIASERAKRVKKAITSAKTKATRAANKAEREAKAEEMKEANENE
ncbi:hypothetical protein MPH47_12145 [Psychrobacillus psychrodurans]|uniref:hypothetical protein n=1 Tax=Psychrobacillus psychrodurans TaxID=126157 RepID=UPI001F4E0B9C|nr:hypothetical protein [Psychrobacillus psychrodurans]MCK1997966.1 hypothetical protein [Psychrobacillus psychrodurans]